MQYNFGARRRSAGGFTLIELMIVITIIAVLLAILLPNMTKARQQALLSSCESNERNLVAGLELYNTHYKRYPNDIQSLYPYYMKRATCPTNKTDYGYTVDPDGKTFTVHCNGKHHLSMESIGEGYPQYTPISGLFLNTPNP